MQNFCSCKRLLYTGSICTLPMCVASLWTPLCLFQQLPEQPERDKVVWWFLGSVWLHTAAQKMCVSGFVLWCVTLGCVVLGGLSQKEIHWGRRTATSNRTWSEWSHPKWCSVLSSNVGQRNPEMQAVYCILVASGPHFASQTGKGCVAWINLFLSFSSESIIADKVMFKLSYSKAESSRTNSNVFSLSILQKLGWWPVVLLWWQWCSTTFWKWSLQADSLYSFLPEAHSNPIVVC